MKKIALILGLALLFGIVSCLKDENSSPTGPSDTQISEEPATEEGTNIPDDKKPSDDEGSDKEPAGDKDSAKEPSGDKGPAKDPSKDKDKEPAGEKGPTKEPASDKDSAKKPAEDKEPAKEPADDKGSDKDAESAADPSATSKDEALKDKEKDLAGKSAEASKSLDEETIPSEAVTGVVWYVHPQPDLSHQLLFDGKNFYTFHRKDAKKLYESTDGRNWQLDQQDQDFSMQLHGNTIYLTKGGKTFRRVAKGDWVEDAAAKDYVAGLHIAKRHAKGPYYTFDKFSSHLNLADAKALTFPEAPAGYAQTDWLHGSSIHSEGDKLFFPGYFKNGAKGSHAALFTAKVGEQALTAVPFPNVGEKLDGYRLSRISSGKGLYMAAATTDGPPFFTDVRIYRSTDAQSWTYVGPFDAMKDKNAYILSFAKFTGHRFIFAVNKPLNTDLRDNTCLLYSSVDLVHFSLQSFKDWTCHDVYYLNGNYYVLARSSVPQVTAIISTTP